MSPPELVLSLLPVLIFLLSLIFLDSYKLVKLPALLSTIVVGCLVAIVCLYLNNWLLNLFEIDKRSYSRYGAPVVEEILKGLYIVYLIRSKKVGFMVDAAIYGFAVGAGFALIENIYYLQMLQDSNIALWIVRGFGTAIMHGGTVAIFGIIAQSRLERHASETIGNFAPPLFLAIALHSIFNHFILPPLITTAVLLVALPVIVLLVFEQSERATRKWLGIGFDMDLELLETLDAGRISETPIGAYLLSLKKHFVGEVVADMLCLLRLHRELAIRAKGILLLRQSGFNVTPTAEIQEGFAELRYLENSIGKTGMLAISPFLNLSRRDLWQLHLLGK
jgi:RsiW-degrading membrane proteinase PrsW (M82 family)